MTRRICPSCQQPIGEPTRKELKVIRKEVRQQSRDELERLHHNTLAHRPWYIPLPIWGRIVSIVLREKARE